MATSASVATRRSAFPPLMGCHFLIRGIRGIRGYIYNSNLAAS